MERVDLTWQYGLVRGPRWYHGWRDGPFATVISIGRLADGRWYAERHGRGASWRDKREGACVYGPGERGRRLAEGTARRWRRCQPGEWIEA